MLQFLQPGWLWLASAIVVPVLIHLWNIREGKTLKVGSTLLLQQSVRQQARSFHIHEWLLLLLRCLLIVLLALLLAAPFWLSQPRVMEQRGWIVIEKQYRNELYRAYGHQIDSLLGAGLQLHYLDSSFSLAKKAALVQASDHLAPDTISYWTYATQLYHKAPSGTPLYLYTGNRLERFGGKRPTQPMNLHWQTTTPTDSLLNWLAEAYLTASDSIRIIKAASNPAALQYTTETISGTAASSKGYKTSFENGKLLLSLTGNEQVAPVEVDTNVLRVAVYTDKYKQDAQYLQAAIRSVQQYSHRRISLQAINDPKAPLPTPNWLFWLSDRPAPSPANCTVFKYASGKERQQASWLLQRDVESTGEWIALYKTVYDNTADMNDEPIWHDGYGQPVLAKSVTGNSTLFKFYSRFNPQWTDLPWNSRFPVWMLQLLLEQNNPVDPLHDKRKMDEHQLMAAVVVEKKNAPAARPLEKTDLWKGVWIAAFLIFFLERGLSHRTKKVPA